MKLKYLVFFMIASCGPAALAQQETLPVLSGVDSLYREDQFYLGFTYNLVTSSHGEIAQSGFSGGFNVGFIRDWPLNERRNIAVGTGVGWAINTYGQNLFIGEGSGSEETIFQIIDENRVDYDSNRYSTQAVEAPIQFRWRTSTPTEYNFWRIYAGVRLSYVYYFHSSFEQPGNSVGQTKVSELNRLQVGSSLSFGYSTFNFYFYYNLTPFFDNNARVDGEHIDMRTIQLGLMFYIL